MRVLFSARLVVPWSGVPDQTAQGCEQRQEGRLFHNAPPQRQASAMTALSASTRCCNPALSGLLAACPLAPSSSLAYATHTVAVTRFCVRAADGRVSGARGPWGWSEQAVQKISTAAENRAMRFTTHLQRSPVPVWAAGGWS